MSEKDLEKVFELFEDLESDFSGSKSEELILKAEKALGKTLPKTYRQFLSKYGCGDIEGVEFYGIINDDFINSSVPDAVWLTLCERKEGLPESLIIISATGNGYYYAIETSITDNQGENPVVLYGMDRIIETVASDFGEFALKLIKSELN